MIIIITTTPIHIPTSKPLIVSPVPSQDGQAPVPSQLSQEKNNQLIPSPPHSSQSPEPPQPGQVPAVAKGDNIIAQIKNANNALTNIFFFIVLNSDF